MSRRDSDARTGEGIGLAHDHLARLPRDVSLHESLLQSALCLADSDLIRFLHPIRQATYLVDHIGQKTLNLFHIDELVPLPRANPNGGNEFVERDPGSMFLLLSVCLPLVAGKKNLPEEIP